MLDSVTKLTCLLRPMMDFLPSPARGKVAFWNVLRMVRSKSCLSSGESFSNMMGPCACLILRSTRSMALIFLRRMNTISISLQAKYRQKRKRRQESAVKSEPPNFSVLSIITIQDMDLRDFQGLTKYKLIIPILYVMSWVGMLLGPLLFRNVYDVACVLVIAYLDYKVLMIFFTMCYVNYRTHLVFRKVNSRSLLPDELSKKDFLSSTQELNYAIIIPNYKEDIELLSETLNVLASHSRASQHYLVFLAMEAHEDGSQQKAEQLMGAFRGKFRAITYTLHQIQPYEQKGKASNVSWCAERIEPFLESYKIDSDSVFVTVIDADSWAPGVYFDLVEEEIIKDYSKRYSMIFMPPQIFTRNHLDVPILTRVHDLLHGYAHCSNLFSFVKLSFPLSNYTLSYRLIKSIGFWDTCSDAIGEDFHTTQKAYWKTGGKIVCVPIYAPFNQVNLATGKGYWEDVKARFWQAERHAQGVADVAYEFGMLFRSRFRFMNLVICFQIFEMFALPSIIPWMLISLLLQKHVLYLGVPHPPALLSDDIMPILFNILSISSTLGYLLYELMKRRANKVLYHRSNEGLLRLLEYPVMFLVNLFLINVPTFAIAAFNVLVGRQSYVVADNKMGKG